MSTKAQVVINALEGAPAVPELVAIYVPHVGWMYYEGGFADHLVPRVWLSKGRATQARFTSFMSKYKDVVPTVNGFGERAYHARPVSEWRVMNLTTGETWPLAEYRELFLVTKKRKKAA